MMVNLPENVLDNIRHRIVETLHPELIYLYGSYAYGTPGTESDIDILVVVDVAADQLAAAAARGYLALQGLKLPIELNLISREGFERRRNWFSSVEREAVEKGKTLYAA